MQTTQHVTPLRDGSFPRVLTGGLVILSLGNGSRFDVIVTPTNEGLCLSVLGHGAYAFHFAPSSHFYLAGKLGLLVGDAECVLRFLRAQF